MASGLPLVELEGDNVGSALGASGELVELVATRGRTRSPTRSSGCSTTARPPPRWRARARAFVEERTWERAGDQVEAALRDFLADPRAGG